MKYYIILLIIILTIMIGCISNNNNNKENIQHPKFGDLEIIIEMESNIYNYNESVSIIISIILKNKSNNTVDINKHYFDEFTFYFIYNDTLFEAAKSSDNYYKNEYISLMSGEEIKRDIVLSEFSHFANKSNTVLYTLQKGNYTVYSTYSYDGGKIESNYLDFKII
jgi:uncharacterized protein YcfL